MTPPVRELLQVRAPSLCPELLLWLADEPVPVWEALEAETGRREGPPFWAHAWPGSLALARAVLDRPALVKAKGVLDFATGCGASAIAAARSGASSVCATEVDHHAVDATRLNASLNGCSDSIEVQARDVIDLDEGWQVVLVGDVFYQADLSRRVFSWLERLSARGATVLIGDPGRSFLPRARLDCIATYPATPNPAWDSVTDRPPRVWRLR